ncbi:chloramphenicol acetyltransferase [Qingshengfaniella alkalisoli]|uniref:Chloramphenicol acetyltransferase n=1 Tax=Qingshengfaniella alkalisoli TaxID=2599296 RepID=A0A5B8JAW9_9RHOB|nr:chloramphenicol acetyltransferase [Qingshengfaniella alkalisoli]QDY71427.1 chloramphenicol acetyltransferase [Qingshengfaniella alkalisoli]
MKKLSSSEPLIHEGCSITDSSFGAFVEIGKNSTLNNATFGDYSYCSRLCDIANAEIGKFSNIASFVRIGATDHPLDRASLHHFMYRSGDYWEDAEHDADFFAHRKSRGAWIGHDTWLGHACQVKPDVSVGDGAVVASGAIVTQDVDPYTIVAGVPAKPIRRRLDPALADRLIALAWWDWPHDRIRGALEDFRALPVATFIEKYEG